MRLLAEFNYSSPDIRIHYLGHSAFVIQFDKIIVVSDYGKPNAWKEWGWDSPILDIGDLVPDIMTYSHTHKDHYDSTRIPEGVMRILKNGESLEYFDLKVTAIPTCEDKFGDFNNTSYLFTYKGWNVIHTGDIQTLIANIENETIARYLKLHFPKEVDILIMPIEGKIKYIPQAEKFIRFLKPKIVIPSHYWSQEYLNEFITYLESMDKINSLYEIHHINEINFNIQDINTFDSILILIPNRCSYKEGLTF